jgi:hypothetical protein
LVISADREQLVFLAVELEALAKAGEFDSLAETEIVQAVERFGPTPLVAGLLLFFCARAEPGQVADLWNRLTLGRRRDVGRAMLSVNAVAAVRSLGVERLLELLRDTTDPLFHDHVVGALCAIVVPESERCLPLLSPSAQAVLASVLAERAGRECLDVPAWIEQLTGPTRGRARIGLAFGRLLARRREPFAAVVTEFSPDDWQAFAALLAIRAPQVGQHGFEFLLPYRRKFPGSADLPWPSDLERAPRLRSRSAAAAADDASPNGGGPLGMADIDLTAAAETSDAERAAAIVARAPAASAQDLDRLLDLSNRIRLPTWRREARQAVLRRAAQLSVTVPGLLNGLPRAAILDEIIAARLTRGDVAVTSRRAWQRLHLHRRFTLLGRLISDLKAGAITPTIARFSTLGRAITEMPAPLNLILATRVIETLAGHAELNEEMLDAWTGIDAVGRFDLLSALGHAHALRGRGEHARELMRLAGVEAERELEADALRRLFELLEHKVELPVEPVIAVSSVLATISDECLPEAIRACIARLPAAMSEGVIADVIARGRSTIAFDAPRV